MPWCGRGLSLERRSVTLAGTTYLRVAYQDAEHTPCDPGLPSFAERPRIRLDFLPPLLPPDGATARGAGSSVSDGMVESSTPIETSRPVAEVVEHFAAQLVAAGWTPSGGTAGGDVEVRRYRLPDDEGHPWVGVLAVWRLGDGRLQAVVRADRADGPP